MSYSLLYSKNQKRLNKIIKKFKNKKVLIYGAGALSCTLMETCDISKLNVVGFCDNKFQPNSTELFYSYKTFSPSELPDIDFDVILINLYRPEQVFEKIKYELLINSKNEDKEIHNLIEFNLWSILKEIFFMD